MISAIGYGTNHSYTSLGPHKFERRAPGPSDVQIEVLFCGVCHSDIHQCANDWGNTIYPCVPGHEIVGRVSAVGSAVTKFKSGDRVGVGCMVDSCRRCASCLKGLEQYCEGPKGATMTYNGPFIPDGTNTFGGYSNSIVVADHFVLRVPSNLDLKGVAPLLCAGITTYSPLRHWNVQPGQTVGVVGLGGLGHVAVKLATALGAHVTVFSTSPEKKDDALRFGAKAFALSTDKEELEKRARSFDFLLSTVPESHDINPYVKLLKRDGTLALVGALGPFAKPTDNSEVAFHRRTVAGSLIGGIAETQEVLDFCGTHGITADVEVIPIESINDAFKKVKKGGVRYRYVIDIANTLKLA
ncbi:NAD(P)-dependent alcohol dehydrogenase [Frigoriglobus tundricola]|uniref:Alcohol dehydrogenase n=1 Tax=Frigoriglobus tundricola TaxID=2774151 RepID=A0A6M5YXV9_9BACT|nr:NAD(P)-dependent alcohol dehydrogenase [Frigoriglobus tundricola]QJW98344.1 Alcohol dehydrogenase [Frigoriglobus tundricola]